MRAYLRKLFPPFLGLVLLMYPLSFQEFVVSYQIPVQSSQTYIVDRLTDANPGGGGAGTGLTGNLRYALTQAQTGDHITFSIAGTINLSSSLPSLTRTISIDGPGANHLTVDGAGGSVFAVGNATTVVISGLTITGDVGNGGGIFNAGTLTLNNIAVSGNQAGDPTNGGGTSAGIWNYTSGVLTINRSTISGNSTVSGNSASEGSGVVSLTCLTPISLS